MFGTKTHAMSQIYLWWLAEHRAQAKESTYVKIEPRVLQYHLAKCATSCGLDNVHFHTLRHTFATRCAEVDFEIKSLSEVLGHSNPKITLERYVPPSLELKRANMEKLSAIGY